MSVTQVERSFIADKEKLLYETWRFTSSLSCTNGDNFLTANLERADDSYTGHLNAGMTESSGVFTFPYTGVYRIGFWPYYYSNSQGASHYLGATISTTADNSSYVSLTEQYDSVSASTDHGAVSSIVNFDVTNVSTHKVKFNCFTHNDCSVIGGSSTNKTYMTFEFLGDT